MIYVQNFWAIFYSCSFGKLILVNNLSWLWLEFEFMLFMKVILLYLSFPWVHESGHLDLSTQSYGHLNKHYSYDYFLESRFWLPRFKPNLGNFRLVFWARSLHEKCVIMSLVSPSISLTPIETTQFNLWLPKSTRLKVQNF